MNVWHGLVSNTEENKQNNAAIPACLSKPTSQDVEETKLKSKKFSGRSFSCLAE